MYGGIQAVGACKGPVREAFVERIAGDCPGTRRVGWNCEMQIVGISDAVGSGKGQAKGLENASKLLDVAAYGVTGACRRSLSTTQIEDNGFDV